MPKRRKSWREKLDSDEGLPKVEGIPRHLAASWGTGTFVVPKPREVDAVMKRVPKGRLITIAEIREKLAKKHRTTTACPMSSGVFASIAAHAAEEGAAAGKRRITPWWRTLKTGGVLSEKFPGGGKLQRKRLEAEGHVVVRRGRSLRVEDFQGRIVRA
jgi:alkylated DNA nucleotide flippase Atl1